MPAAGATRRGFLEVSPLSSMLKTLIGLLGGVVQVDESDEASDVVDVGG
jgi:hypothetical protein